MMGVGREGTRGWAVLAVGLLVVLGACGEDVQPRSDTHMAEDLAVDTSLDDAMPTGVVRVGTTHPPSGNRLYLTSGQITTQTPALVELETPATWVVGVEDGEGFVWVTVGANGSVVGLRLRAGLPEPVDVGVAALPAGAAPVLVAADQGVSLWTRADAAPLGAPVVVDTEPLSIAYMALADELVLAAGEQAWQASLAGLSDGKLAASGERIYVLAGASDRYGHGILGDPDEPTEIVAFTAADPPLEEQWRASTPAVFEALGPLVYDLDQDGVDEVLLTESDAAAGARLVVYDGAGTRIAASDPIGTGYRWRHLLAAGPLGPNGAVEVVDVRTPHIGGVVQHFRLVGQRLELVAQLPGFSTHRIGSRNLDQGFAADIDGDGQNEVVVPTQSQTALVGLRRTASGLQEVWRFELGSGLSSNIAVVEGSAGLAMAAATEDGRLWVWQP